MKQPTLRKHLRSIALFCPMFVLVTFASAQEISLTNGFGTPLYLNGGYAGTQEQNELSLQVQKNAGGKLVAIPGFNHVATIDFKVPKLRGGIGIVWASEYARQLWNYSIFKGIYALHLPVQENLSLHPFLSLGLGLNHLSEDFVMFGTSLQGPLNKAYFTPGAGMLVKYGTFHAGFSAEHFNKPEVGWENIGYTMDPEFILHARYGHEAEPGITLYPGLIGKWQGPLAVVIPSVELNYQGFIIGLNAKHSTVKGAFSQTGIGGMIGVELQTIKIMYSYTGRIAGELLRTLPSHEFSFSYRFGNE